MRAKFQRSQMGTAFTLDWEATGYYFANKYIYEMLSLFNCMWYRWLVFLFYSPFFSNFDNFVNYPLIMKNSSSGTT